MWWSTQAGEMQESGNTSAAQRSPIDQNLGLISLKSHFCLNWLSQFLQNMCFANKNQINETLWRHQQITSTLSARNNQLVKNKFQINSSWYFLMHSFSLSPASIINCTFTHLHIYKIIIYDLFWWFITFIIVFLKKQHLVL